MKALKRPLQSGQEISAELAEARTVLRKFVPAWRSLFEEAKKGEPWAVHYLVWTVRDGVELLTKFARESDGELLETLQAAAQRMERWPIWRSHNPMLDTPDDEVFALFNRLKLGEGLPYFSGGTARLGNDPLSAIAKELVRRIESMRNLRLRERKYCDIWEKDFKWPPWANQAEALPPFGSGKDFEPWWKLAKKLFLKRYPKPHVVTDFARHVSDDAPPYEARAQILKTLKRKLRALAKILTFRSPPWLHACFAPRPRHHQVAHYHAAKRKAIFVDPRIV